MPNNKFTTELVRRIAREVVPDADRILDGYDITREEMWLRLDRGSLTVNVKLEHGDLFRSWNDLAEVIRQKLPEDFRAPAPNGLDIDATG